jgi:phage head maturation protease
MDGMQPTRREMPQRHHLARFAPETFRSADGGAATVEVVVSTGSRVGRTDFWTGERYFEELAMVPQAIRLGRMAEGGAPALADHENSVDAVVGVVERAWLAGRELRAEIRFAADDRGQEIARRVRDGILRNVSVGYLVHRYEVDRPTDGSPSTWRAVDWEPMEVSFVAVPADPAAGVREAQRTSDCEIVNRAAQRAPNPEVLMDTQTTGAQAPATPAMPDLDAERRAAQENERTRVRGIMAAARTLGLDDQADALIAEGVSLEAAQSRLITAVAQRAPAAPAPAHTQVIRDEGDTVRAGIQGALESRLSHTMPEGPAREFRGATLIDLGVRLLDQRGIATRGWSRSEIAQAMLGLPVSGRSLQTTSDFAALLANVQSKRLLSSYMASARTFTSWTARRSLPDFKTTQVVEVGAAPTLLALAEGGTIQLGAMQDAGETYNLVRYARNVSLSYPAIVNDDLGGFDRVPAAFATAAANLENQAVYDVLATNANMSDSNPLFSAAHANTAAGVMDVAGVTAARSQILRQTDPTGQRIMVMPSVIVVPVELAGTARALFSATVVPAGVATTAVNPWQGSFSLVETNFLADTNDYFVTVAAGSGYEAVEVGYEAGSEGPQLSSYVSPDVDGVVFSCRHSFGAKAVTWRTIARVTQ